MRRGFTLTELLVVIAIIGVLAVMVLAGLSAAVEDARERKSLAAVKVLGAYMHRRVEAYATRQLPVTQQHLEWIANDRGWPSSPVGWRRARLEVLRELMRLELPYRWRDVVVRQWDGSEFGEPDIWPVVAQRWSVLVGSDEFQGAELLYLIVSSDTSESTRMLVARIDVGDADGDGLREFHDGWGNPISWQRWPRNYPPSGEHDPFDYSRCDPVGERRDPVVISAGPDGSFGLWHACDGLSAVELADPSFAGPEMVGDRVGDDWMDNITSRGLIR